MDLHSVCDFTVSLPLEQWTDFPDLMTMDYVFIAVISQGIFPFNTELSNEDVQNFSIGNC